MLRPVYKMNDLRAGRNVTGLLMTPMSTVTNMVTRLIYGFEEILYRKMAMSQKQKKYYKF